MSLFLVVEERWLTHVIPSNCFYHSHLFPLSTNWGNYTRSIDIIFFSFVRSEHGFQDYRLHSACESSIQHR